MTDATKYSAPRLKLCAGNASERVLHRSGPVPDSSKAPALRRSLGQPQAGQGQPGKLPTSPWTSPTGFCSATWARRQQDQNHCRPRKRKTGEAPEHLQGVTELRSLCFVLLSFGYSQQNLGCTILRYYSTSTAHQGFTLRHPAVGLWVNAL